MRNSIFYDILAIQLRTVRHVVIHIGKKEESYIHGSLK